MPPATRHCKDANRRGDFEHASFDFLGYTFRGRLAKGRRGYFTGFSPAINATAKKARGKQIRDWHLNRRSGADLSILAKEINPQVQGWINYYGAFYRSELCFLAWRINEHLVRWAMHKFKRFRGKYARAMDWLQEVYQYRPRLLFRTLAARRIHLRPDCGGRMTGDRHVRCESGGG
jgi:RNA-directed DNA polymerase